jgi:pimeloyl-ACP methyl ester carboxylesterase
VSIPAYFPYRSSAARDSFLAYYDSLAGEQWPVASAERIVPTSYGDTFVRITGPADAPPLVLLPGAVATSLMWAPNIQALSQTCRTFALDQIGDIGRTTCIKRVRCLNELRAWLDEFFDALKVVGRINLMGVSYGGSLAAEYARHAPQRLSTVILLAPGATVLRLSARFVIRLALAAIAPRWYFPRLFLCRSGAKGSRMA